MRVCSSAKARLTTRLLAIPALSACVQAQENLARSVLKELIEVNTTDSVGDNTAAAQAMVRRLLAAGFAAGDVQVVVPAPKKSNLVVRLRGTTPSQPVLFLAHLDVVEARREDWTMDIGQGTLQDHMLVCPWHEWAYDCRSGENDYDPAIKLERFAVKAEGDDIFLDTESRA